MLFVPGGEDEDWLSYKCIACELLVSLSVSLLISTDSYIEKTVQILQGYPMDIQHKELTPTGKEKDSLRTLWMDTAA